MIFAIFTIFSRYNVLDDSEDDVGSVQEAVSDDEGPGDDVVSDEEVSASESDSSLDGFIVADYVPVRASDAKHTSPADDEDAAMLAPGDTCVLIMSLTLPVLIFPVPLILVIIWMPLSPLVFVVPNDQPLQHLPF